MEKKTIEQIKPNAMNQCNPWQEILTIANKDLEKFGYSLMITEPEKGFYDCEVWKNGELEEIYAENYYEDELSDLVIDAWHDTKLKLV